MPFQVDYFPDGDYTFMYVTGELNGELAVEMVTEWLKIARRENCLRALVDFSEVKLTETIIGLYQFASNMSDLGIPRRMRMAAVIKTNLENHNFFQIVAMNNGWIYRNFEDLETAKAWLLGLDKPEILVNKKDHDK